MSVTGMYELLLEGCNPNRMNSMTEVFDKMFDEYDKNDTDFKKVCSPIFNPYSNEEKIEIETQKHNTTLAESSLLSECYTKYNLRVKSLGKLGFGISYKNRECASGIKNIRLLAQEYNINPAWIIQTYLPQFKICSEDIVFNEFINKSFEVTVKAINYICILLNGDIENMHNEELKEEKETGSNLIPSQMYEHLKDTICDVNFKEGQIGFYLKTERTKYECVIEDSIVEESVCLKIFNFLIVDKEYSTNLEYVVSKKDKKRIDFLTNQANNLGFEFNNNDSDSSVFLNADYYYLNIPIEKFSMDNLNYFLTLWEDFNNLRRKNNYD